MESWKSKDDYRFVLSISKQEAQQISKRLSQRMNNPPELQPAVQKVQDRENAKMEKDADNRTSLDEGFDNLLEALQRDLAQSRGSLDPVEHFSLGADELEQLLSELVHKKFDVHEG